MGSTFLNKITLFGSIGLMWLTISCSDDAMLVGKDLLPEEYNLKGNTYVVPGIEAMNAKRDSIKSDQVTTAILGDFLDESFGRTNGSFIGQLSKGELLDTTRFNLPDYEVISLELILSHKYLGWYGDKDAQHELKVYELTTLFPRKMSDVYYSNIDLTGHYLPTPIGIDTLIGNSLDSAGWVAAKKVDYLKIKLNDELTHRFFNQIDQEMLSDNSKFQDFFKGIYITSQKIVSQNGSSNKGSLVNCNAMGDGLGLVLRYRHINANDNNKVDTLSHVFPFSREGITVNKFTHELSPNINFENPETPNLYAQGMAGSYVKVTLPEELLLQYGDSLKVTTPGERLAFSSVTMEVFLDQDSLKLDPNLVDYFPLPDSLILSRFNDYELDDNNINLSNDKIEAPFYKNIATSSTLAYAGVSVGVLNKTTYSYKFTINNTFFEHVVSRDDMKVTTERKGGGNEDDFSVLYIGPSNPLQNFKRVILYGQHRPNSDKKGVVMKIRTAKY